MTTHQVKYTGPTQHTRILTAADGKNIGVIFPKEDMVWSLDNHHTLLLDDLDETAVEFFEAKDGDGGDFKVRELQVAEGDEPPVAKPSKAEAADATIAEENAGTNDVGGLGDGTGTTGSATTSTTGTGRGGRASTTSTV